MKEIYLNAYLPLMYPIPFADFKARFNKAFEEFIELNGRISFPIDEIGTHQVNIRNIEDLHEIEKPKWHKETARFHSLICISTSIIIDDWPALNDSDDIEFSEDELEEFWVEQIIYVFEKRIYDLIVLANLAKLGIFEFQRGWIEFNDNIVSETKQFLNDLVFAVDRAEKYKWPNINDINISDTWSWGIAQEGFLTGFGGNNIGKALNAFTYFFHDNANSQPLDLFWAMLGLESIYCDSSINVQEQVWDRAQILLGTQLNHKRKFKLHYSFRSRLIHGDIEFPTNFSFYDDINKVGSYYNDITNSQGFSQAILISTFQYLIKKNWHEINFDTKTDVIGS